MTILLISDDLDYANAIRKHTTALIQVTRTMLLASNWNERRDELMSQANVTLIDLPHDRTVSGTRNDRKIIERIISFVYLNENPSFAIIAPSRSNTWQLYSVHRMTSLPSSNLSCHSCCRFNAQEPQSRLPLF